LGPSQVDVTDPYRRVTRYRTPTPLTEVHWGHPPRVSLCVPLIRVGLGV